MAYNPFAGWTEAELLAARREVQNEMMQGGALTSGGAGGTSFGRAPQFSAKAREYWIRISLNAINPTLYPLSGLQPTSEKPTFYQSTT
jgi:hypothetical protein